MLCLQTLCKGVLLLLLAVGASCSQEHVVEFSSLGSADAQQEIEGATEHKENEEEVNYRK